MKLSVVVVVLCLVVLALGKRDDEGGKGKGKHGKLPKLGRGKKGHGFKPPKGAEEEGLEVSVDGARFKLVYAKKGIKLIAWNELDEDQCQKPAEPLAEEGAQQGQGQTRPKGCPARPLMFRMHDIYEVYPNKTKIEDAGHFVTLKDHQFTCTDPGDSPTAVAFTAEAGAPQGIKIPCVLTLSAAPSATITFSAYLTTEAGNFTNGDEEVGVEVGEVKFNVDVVNWNFLAGADGLVFEVSVGSRGKPKKDDKRRPNPGQGKKAPKDFEMDDGAKLTFSGKAKVGGTWENVPNDVEVEERKDDNLFKVYLPKGSSIFYDPTGDAGVEDAETNDEFGSSSPGAIYLPVATLLTTLLVAILNTV